MTADTLDQFAAALGVAALTADEQRLILDCARDVAHGSERRYAPLAAFLLGVSAAAAPDRGEQLRRGIACIDGVLADP